MDGIRNNAKIDDCQCKKDRERVGTISPVSVSMLAYVTRGEVCVNALDLVGTSAPKPVRGWLPPAGGLLVAAVVAFFVCPWPVVHSLTPGALIGIALVSLLEVFLANAVTQWTLAARPAGTTELQKPRLIKDAAFCALWLAPLALFVRENSPWAVVIVGVLAASAVESCRIQKDCTDCEPWPLLTDDTLFSSPEMPTHFQRQAWGTLAALCAQAGAVAAFADLQFVAAALVGISSSVWTWAFTRYAPDTHSTTRSRWRPLGIVALTIILTVGGLIRYLPHAYGIRGLGLPGRAEARGGSPTGERIGQTNRR